MEEKWFHHEYLTCEDGALTRDQPNSSDMSSRNFPSGLRVLLFDEDPQYLLTLEKHLQEFKYEVTKCDEEERAMFLLRNDQIRFDVAIIEVQDSESNRFRLISEMGSKTDLPIIIMSQDDSVESVVTWMKNGACDYLVKPVRPEDLRLIYKHVAKKIRVSVSNEEKSLSVATSNPNKRNRDDMFEAQTNEDQNHDQERGSTSRKKRVVWDDELHRKFMDAVEHLGIDYAVPKKILELMNVDYISRENVASHLQKFRMNKKRQKNGRDEKNLSMITLQNESMRGGEEATQFYNVEFPTNHINNILQPFWGQRQQQTTSSNITTQLIPSLEQHHGVSVAFPSTNQLMSQRTHHQTLEFACIENAQGSLGYSNFEMHNEEEADEVATLTNSFTQKSEEIGLFPLQESMMANTMIAHDHSHLNSSLELMHVHQTETSMLIPSLPSSSYSHGYFHNQQEMVPMNNKTGGYRYNNNGYFFDSKRPT